MNVRMTWAGPLMWIFPTRGVGFQIFFGGGSLWRGLLCALQSPCHTAQTVRSGLQRAAGTSRHTRQALPSSWEAGRVCLMLPHKAQLPCTGHSEQLTKGGRSFKGGLSPPAPPYLTPLLPIPSPSTSLKLGES